MDSIYRPWGNKPEEIVVKINSRCSPKIKEENVKTETNVKIEEENIEVVDSPTKSAFSHPRYENGPSSSLQQELHYANANANNYLMNNYSCYRQMFPQTDNVNVNNGIYNGPSTSSSSGISGASFINPYHVEDAFERTSSHHSSHRSSSSSPVDSHSSSNSPISSSTEPRLIIPTPQYHANLYNQEMLRNNLATSLGVPPTDPFLLESIARGFSIEEYNRVICNEQLNRMTNRKQRPKKFKCPHCDQGFSNNGQLKGHIRIHTGERPFKCDVENCDKTFTRNEELTRHKRIHSGFRPFACSECNKTFGRKDHLKKHLKTHLNKGGVVAIPFSMSAQSWIAAANAGLPLFPILPC